MKLPLYWIDAFTRHIFSGNPAAVVPLKSWLADDKLQLIAFENGLSETAFFVRTSAHAGHLRWFTPAAEVDLCGHATLATAFVAFNWLGQTGDRLGFDSRSGPLTVTRIGELLELDFPAQHAEPVTAPPAALLAGLGARPREWHRSRNSYLAVFASESEVLDVRPDFGAWASLGDTRLIVTAPGRDSDFVSRFFAPGVGVPEDPVTGSAHCTLIPYWAQRIGKTKLHARQVSARGGELFCEFAGQRVKIGGHCALYLRGELEL
jgi:PhzF family phenazine biosynthesis protein